MIKYMPLGDICTNIIDCPHESPEWKSEGIPVIRNFNLINGQIDMSDGYYVDEETYRKRTRRAVPSEGDIIFSREAPIGNCAIVPKGFKCCLGQRLVQLQVNHNICSSEYLLAVLQSSYVKQQIDQVSKRGSIVSNFAIGDLHELIIPVLESQNSIAELSSSVMQKQSNNTAIAAILEDMKKLFYNYWFVQFDFPDNNGNPYKSTGGKMTWNEELKRSIPDGWRYDSFSSCIQSINTGLNPRDNFKLNIGGTIHYLTVKNLTTEGTIDFTSCDYIDESARAIVHNRSDIQVGDILFASISPLGRCYIISEEPKDWDINESVFSIRPNKENMTSNYLYLTFMSDYFVRLAEGNSAGSVFKGIRISELLNLKTIIPPKEVLDAFDSVVNRLFELKTNAVNENQELSELRDFLLPMLMNGQVKFKEQNVG